MDKFFAVAFSATKDQGTYVVAGYCWRNNKEEASGAAIDACRNEVFPIDKGFSSHQVSVDEIEWSIIENVRKANKL